MANETTEKATALTRYGAVLIVAAHLLLVVGSLLRRASFAEAFEVALFNPRFTLFFAAVLLLAGLSIWGVWRGALQVSLRRHPRLILLALFLLSGLVIWISSIWPSLNTFRTVLIGYALLLCSGAALSAFKWRLPQVRWNQVQQAALLAILGIGVPILLLEGGLRLYFGVYGTLEQKVVYLYSAEDALSLSNRYTPQAYVNFMPSPNFGEHNADGYRGDNLQTPKPPETFRIFALGGSTTYGTDLAPEEAYPAQLQRILHEEYGYTHIDVVNAGVEIYTSYDSLANLAYRVLDDGPDMILIYHGINDVRARLVDPEAYSGLNAERGQWSTAALEEQIPDSVLLRFLQVQLGVGPNLLNTESFVNATSRTRRCGIGETFCVRLDRSAEEVLTANPPLYFERNLRNMIAIARANEVQPVLSTWAYYPGEDVQNPTVMSLPHLQAGVAEHNEIVAQLGAAVDVPVATPEMPQQAPYWIDGMHMTARGAAEQAAQYAAFLIENDLLPAP